MLLSRRDLIGGAASLVGARRVPAWRAPSDPTPFTLGVASGDPTPDGFVIWTRLAPVPLAPDGSGGISGPVRVRWEVASDPAMRRVVVRGSAVADDRFAHAVHVEVQGLAPGRPYWYRFMALGARSPMGRAVTAPAPGQEVARLRMVLASCAHWEMGWFSAYRHMAEESPDLVFFLGDYIYEHGLDPARAADAVRRHDRPDEITDLVGYRNRYALHRTDPDLQALHAAAPSLATWDDHEVQNDYAGRWSEHPETDPAVFLKRRAAAYQAFYEHMPLRPLSLPNGPDMRVYRRFDHGALAQVSILDGRQYRSKQPCEIPGRRGGHVAAPGCAERTAEDRTMLGAEQERWLYDGFGRSKARWNLIAQDLLIAPYLQKDPRSGLVGHWTDAWDGYPATRARMLQAVADSRVANPVFFGGDLHSFWTNDLKLDFDDPKAPTVATEFVGTSITSDGPDYALIAQMLPSNPHVRYFESRRRGYLSVDLTPDRMETRFQVISDRRDPRAKLSTLKRFVVESGKAGAVEA